MRMVLRNGFVHPSQTFSDNDDLDALVEDAARRSVVVQGVRCIRFVAGALQVEFHDGRATLEAQMKTGWPNRSETALCPALKPRDGAHPSIVVDGYAYGDLEVDQDKAA